MKYEVELVTPEKAAQYLRLNKGNRPIRKDHVRNIVRSILNGEWEDIGDPVRLGDDRLLDGQHRLMAIVESGVSLSLLVVSGLENRLFSKIDTGGIARTAGDVLAQAGIPNPTCVASIIRMVRRYKVFGDIEEGRLRRMTNQEVLDIALADDRYSQSGVFGRKKFITGLLRPSLLGSWHYCTTLASQDTSEEADGFWAAVRQCKPFNGNSNTVVLRDRLASDRDSGKKTKESSLFKYGVVAWNAYRRGVEISRIQVRSDSKIPPFI